MLQLSDLKHTRVYQEGREEGKEEGKQEIICSLLRYRLGQLDPVAEPGRAAVLAPGRSPGQSLVGFLPDSGFGGLVERQSAS